MKSVIIVACVLAAVATGCSPYEPVPDPSLTEVRSHLDEYLALYSNAIEASGPQAGVYSVLKIDDCRGFKVIAAERDRKSVLKTIDLNESSTAPEDKQPIVFFGTILSGEIIPGDLNGMEGLIQVGQNQYKYMWPNLLIKAQAEEAPSWIPSGTPPGPIEVCGIGSVLKYNGGVALMVDFIRIRSATSAGPATHQIADGARQAVQIQSPPAMSDEEAQKCGLQVAVITTKWEGLAQVYGEAQAVERAQDEILAKVSPECAASLGKRAQRFGDGFGDPGAGSETRMQPPAAGFHGQAALDAAARAVDAAVAAEVTPVGGQEPSASSLKRDSAPERAAAIQEPANKALVYTVLLKQTRVEAEANALRDQALAQGFDAFVIPLEISQATIHRVYAGRVATRSAAVDLAGDARAKLGTNSAIVVVHP